MSSPLSPISSNPVSSNVPVGTSSAIGASSPNAPSTTLNAVNSIMNALVGTTAAADTAPAGQIMHTTMSGALGNSIGSLIKSTDKKLDMSEEDWAQEIVQHQDSAELQSQDFSNRIRKDVDRLGQSGFDIPGMQDSDMQDLVNGDE